MKFSREISCLIALLSMVQCTVGCTLPKSWYHNSGLISFYYTGYRNGKGRIVRLNPVDAGVWFDASSSIKSTCTSVDENAGNFSTVAFQNNENNHTYCQEVIMANQVMFSRRTAESKFRTEPYNISECMENLGEREQFKAYIYYPITPANWIQFGPPNGVYQFQVANYSVIVGEIPECKDPAATLRVSGNKWMVSSSCIFGSQSYENPFAGDVTVVSGLADSELSVTGSGSASGMIVLSIVPAVAPVPGINHVFHILRYSVVTDIDGSQKWNFFMTTGNEPDPTGFVSTEFVSTTLLPSLISANLTSTECKSATDLCKNGGSCVQEWLKTSCACAPGFEGDTCETNTDDCASMPCKNGATCVDGINDFECQCATGFGGVTCIYDDKCVGSPCKNNGTCYTSKGEYICECPDPFVGRDCTVQDFCRTDNPCQNGGTCLFSKDGYYCFCPFGISGKNCEINNGTTGCTQDTCQNGGTCIQTAIGFFCQCTLFYEGNFCENLSDWFIVAMVLAGLVLLILLVSLVLCCCYCCYGWRPNNSSYTNMTNSESSLKMDQTGTVEFNFSPASPSYGIQLLGSR